MPESLVVMRSDHAMAGHAMRAAGIDLVEQRHQRRPGSGDPGPSRAMAGGRSRSGAHLRRPGDCGCVRIMVLHPAVRNLNAS
jgi:hypothetical protein